MFIHVLCLTAKECGGVLTDQEKIIHSPGFPDEYQDKQICYWHIRVRLDQRILIQFLEFDVEDDMSCLADYLEIYDSYDDVSGFVGRWSIVNIYIVIIILPFLLDLAIAKLSVSYGYIWIVPSGACPTIWEVLSKIVILFPGSVEKIYLTTSLAQVRLRNNNSSVITVSIKCF